MRFTIKNTGCGSERVGTLSDFRRSAGTIIETPTAALLTQGGSVVHLTAEVLAKVFPKPQLLWVPLSNTVQLEAGVKAQNEGVAKFAGLPQHVTCSTLHNVSEETPEGHFENNKVPMWTKRGKRMISASRYMDIMEVFKPDIILVVADGCITLDEANKRVTKAVSRTSNLLHACVEKFQSSKRLRDSSLIGVIVGASDLNVCEENLHAILKHVGYLQGVALEGLTDGTEKSLNIEPDHIKDVFEKINNVLPNGLLRIVEGAWNPAVVLTAIEHGWDLFDGSYVVKLTNSGLALRLNFDVTQEADTTYLLDMNNECYKEDFTPILDTCECLCCKKHTRAYIRHLLNTREMLASVLLSIHNLYHFDQMFYHARQHITANTFLTYKRYITKQCENSNITYRYKASNDYKESSQQIKKIKTDEIDKI